MKKEVVSPLLLVGLIIFTMFIPLNKGLISFLRLQPGVSCTVALMLAFLTGHALGVMHERKKHAKSNPALSFYLLQSLLVVAVMSLSFIVSFVLRKEVRLTDSLSLNSSRLKARVDSLGHRITFSYDQGWRQHEGTNPKRHVAR